MGKRSNKINKILEMPREVIGKVPRITVIGFDEVLIENFKYILEYEDCFARICTHIGNINICGLNLILTQMTEDDILVYGKIERLSFENCIKN